MYAATLNGCSLGRSAAEETTQMGFFDDLANGAASVASGLGDVVDAVVTTVTEGADEIVDTLADGATGAVEAVTFGIGQTLGSGAGAVANVVGGTALGFVEAGRDMVHAGADMVRGLGKIVSSALRLDLPGVLQGIAEFYLGFTELILASVRLATGGYIAGGIVRLFERDALHQFIEDLLDKAFSGDPARLASARTRLRMDQSDFGLRVGLTFKTVFFDSATSDLAALHTCGHINLYGLAGLDPLAFGTRFVSQTVVTSVDARGNDSWMPINRFTINRHIESGGTENRLRVYSLARRLANQRVKTAIRKLKKMRILMEDPGVGWGWPYWNYPRHEGIARLIRNEDGTASCSMERLGQRAWFDETLSLRRDRPVFALDGSQLLDLNGDVDGDGIDDVVPVFERLDQFMRSEGGRTADAAEDCRPLANCVINFTLAPDRRVLQGETEARDIFDDPDPPDDSLQVDRDDGAFVTIDRVDRMDPNNPLDDQPVGSGVVFRDRWPEIIFKYVLAHELGHYFGLAHPGHSFKEIMFTIAPDQGASLLDPGVFGYYMESEPEFTLKDGKNSWRFIADQMLHCIAPVTRPATPAGRARAQDARRRDDNRR